jgi:hypothetical protein
MLQHPIFEDTSVPWAIDMDGTLIREDVTELAINLSMLNPLMWHTFMYALLVWLFQTETHAHRYLEIRFPPDPKKLTYNNTLINRIETHRKEGGHVILATASHYLAATPVAKHVDLFDAVLGSDPPLIMDAKADEKARLLSIRFPKGFVYAGNSKDDIKVWNCEACKAMMLVNCKPEVLEMARQIQKPYIVIQ